MYVREAVIITIKEALVRFIAGGTLVLLISMLGRSKYGYLAGLAVLFPAITLVGYYFLSFTMSGLDLQRTILFSLFSVPTVLAFLLAVYLTVNKMPIISSLGIGIISWMISAIIIIIIDKNFWNLWGG